MGSWTDKAASFVPSAVSSAAQQYLPTSVAAAVGVSAGPEIYDQVDREYFEKPQNVLGAYDQGITWLLIGARRADALGQKNAQSMLNQFAAAMKKEQADVAAKASMLCKATGYGCPRGDSLAVLQRTAQLVTASGLGQTDRDKILGILQGPIASLRFARALPWVGLTVVVGAGFAYSKYKKR